MKRTLTAIAAVLLAAAVFAGCGADIDMPVSEASSPTISPQQTDTKTAAASPEVSAEESPAIADIDDAGAKVITTEEDIPIFKSGLTLQEAGSYLNIKKAEAVIKLGGNYEEDVEYDEIFESYESKGKELRLISYSPDDSNQYFSFIECDKSRVNLIGVRDPMDFDQIRNILGKTDVITIKRGLPGCVSYELRYIIGGVKVKFYSWRPDGSDSFNMSIAKDFDPGDEYIRISHEILNEYFTMSEEEINKKLGTPEEGSADYPDYFLSIDYNDGKVSQIWLQANYEIDGIRYCMEKEDVLKKLGKPSSKRYYFSGEEDRMIDQLYYNYKEFFIEYDFDDEEFYGLFERFIYSLSG